ncbi:MAG: hypothetical protein KAJ07_10370 [Planctomycetes bacterium]|nr:hypothetical protein [Planctomycetota bacterium]
MLHNRHRKKRIHVLTLDNVLARDVCARISDSTQAKYAEIVLPNDGKKDITVAHIESMVKDTVSSQMLVFDVRSYTLTRLLEAYNKIVGYNRADFSLYCNTILIGDGPLNISKNPNGLKVFQQQLARMRVDYSPGAFFYDPLMEHSYSEKIEIATGRNVHLPAGIPRHMANCFKGEVMTVEKVRGFLSAIGDDTELRPQKKLKRLRTLRDIYYKKITERYNADPNDVAQSLTSDGFAIPGEILSLNIYPFSFEKHIDRQLLRSKIAIQSKCKRSLAS